MYRMKVLLLVSMVYILTTVTSRIVLILLKSSVYCMHGSHVAMGFKLRIEADDTGNTQK